jgi:hypothetical protein
MDYGIIAHNTKEKMEEKRSKNSILGSKVVFLKP